MARRLLALAVIVAACGGSGTETTTTLGVTSTSEAVTTTTAAPTTTTRPTPTTTTTRALPLTWDAAPCTLLTAGAWFVSEFGDVSAFGDRNRAILGVFEALGAMGANADELYEQQGTIGIGGWLLGVAQEDPRLYEDGEYLSSGLGACVSTPLSIKHDADEDNITRFAQIFAGRYDLPGRLPTDEELAALDPDGDGLYYVHAGQGDSESFQVPSRFRITYTGTSPTCAVYIVEASSGEELEWVSNLDGGGFSRVFLSDPLTEIYLGDIIGCRNGSLQVGPDQ